MQPTTASLPHSGLGIASFIISLVAGVGLLVIFGIAGVAEAQPNGLDEESLMAGVLGMLMLLAAMTQVVALAALRAWYRPGAANSLASWARCSPPRPCSAACC